MSGEELQLVARRFRRRRKGLSRKIRAWSSVAIALSMPVVLLLMAMGRFFGIQGEPRWLVQLIGSIVTFPWIAFVGSFLAAWGDWRSGSVSASPAAIRVAAGGGVRQIDPATIAAARTTESQILLEHENGDLDELELESPGDAQALVYAAGLDARHRRADYHMGDTFFRRFLYGLCIGLGSLLAFTLASVRLSPGSPALVTSSLFVVPFLAIVGGRWAATTKVTVGVDGILERRPLGRSFHPLDGLTSAKIGVGGIELLYADGRKALIGGTKDSFEEMQAVVDRIREAIEARKTVREDAPLPKDLLAREGRKLTDWRTALASLIKGESTYRGVSLGREDAGRVLDDPAASPEHRIGAAMALAATGEDEARTRIRVAAETCAEPKLRVALEAALEPEMDEDTVERAMVTR